MNGIMCYNETTPLSESNNPDLNLRITNADDDNYHNEDDSVSIDEYNEYWDDEGHDFKTMVTEDYDQVKMENKMELDGYREDEKHLDVTSACSSTIVMTSGDDEESCVENKDEDNSRFEYISNRSTSLQNSLSSSSSSQQKTRSNDSHMYLLAYCVCVLLGIVSGTMYGFGRYSLDLKDHLNLTQSQLQLLGALMDCGNFLTKPLCGIIYDRYGSRITCLLAGTISFYAYSTIQSIVGQQDWHNTQATINADSVESNNMTTHHFLVLCGCFFAVGIGCGFGHMAALASTTKIFSSGAKKGKQGLAIGIVVAAFALCSTLIGLSYSKLGGLDHNFFFILGIIICASNLVGAFILPSYDNAGTLEQNDLISKSNRAIQKTPVILAKGGTENTAIFSFDREDLATIGYGAVIKTECEYDEMRTGYGNDMNAGNESSTRSTSSEILAWFTCDYWLLFLVFFGATGCGLFIINNVSTMVQSIGGTDNIASFLVVLLCLCNCFGRIGIGYVADKVCQINLFALSLGMIALGMTIGALANGEYAIPCLAITIALVALAYGGIWVLIVTILADWFGHQNFGKNYGLAAIAPAFSGFIVNSISGWNYHRHADFVLSMNGTGLASEICIGVECYFGTFALAACTGISCLLVFPVLKHRRHQRCQT